MGIYDREYYRDETGGSGWLSGVAPMTRMLILVNVGVFLAQLFLGGDWLTETFSARSDAIFEHFHVWQLVTYSFLHDTGSLWHIALNMLFLFFVGREVEPIYGSREFLWFYVGGAAVAGLVWSLIDYFGPTHGHQNILLGASGAVTAVLMVFVLYYPQREFLIWGVLPVRAWMLLAFYIGQEVYAVLTMAQMQRHGVAPPGANVAYTAHLAGYAYGWAYKASGFRWTRLFRFPFFQNRPRLRIVPPEPRERSWPRTSSTATTLPDPPAPFSPSARPASTSVLAEDQLDARLDEVLAKIAREGRGSLTDEEHRILQEASRRAQNKRSERLH
jgi:membrane associated rhomboid family serine protease